MNSYVVWILIILLSLSFIYFCTSCAVTGTAPVDIIPTTAWNSTMRAVAQTNWFGTFCLLSFFGGIVAIGLDQRKIGGAVVIAAIATLCLGLAIHRFPTWLAIIGFTSSIIAVGYSILIKNKALVEIIKGIQIFKNNELEPDAVRHLKGELGRQSDSTKKIVTKVKEKNGLDNQNKE